MCHHTWEPTVLSRVSCRPSHMNFDRFHQPCLFTWAHSRVGEDCHPRTTWRPLTLRAARLFLLASHWKIFATPTGRYHGRVVTSPFTPANATPKKKRVFAHTQVRDPCESAAACCGPALGHLISLAICIVVQYFSHDNIACIHMCDECMRSNAPNVCHRLLSIS